jgi:hypothetical protein
LVRPGASLPAQLWRQPAVRAAVRTGATAIALSLTLRLARGWLAHSPARGVPRRFAPALSRRLAEVAAPRSGASGVETVETWVHVRQVRTSH